MTEVAVTGWQKPPDRNANKKPSSDKEDIMRRNTIKLRRSKEIDTRSCTNAQKEKKKWRQLVVVIHHFCKQIQLGFSVAANISG